VRPLTRTDHPMRPAPDRQPILCGL